jgi:hypothetical protein
MKAADGNQKVKDFFTSEKRKRSSESSSAYPPPLTLESPLKSPNSHKSVKFSRVSSRGPRDTESDDELDLSFASPTPRDLEIFIPVLARQKSSRKLSDRVTEERFDEHDQFSIPRSSNPPLPPNRQESASRIASDGRDQPTSPFFPRNKKARIKGFLGGVGKVGEVSSESIETKYHRKFIPTSIRSNNPPLPPIRKESIPIPLKSLNTGFVRQRVEALDAYSNLQSASSAPRSDLGPNKPIRQESRVPDVDGGTESVIEHIGLNTNHPFNRSPKRSTNPPSPPIRKESTPGNLKASNSWNIDLSNHEGFVLQRVKNRQSTTPQSNNSPMIPIQKDSTLEGSWNVDLSQHGGVVRQLVEEYSNSLEGS